MPNKGEGSPNNQNGEEIKEYQRLRNRLFANSQKKKVEASQYRPGDSENAEGSPKRVKRTLKWPDSPEATRNLIRDFKTPFSEVQERYKVPQKNTASYETNPTPKRSPGPSSPMHEEDVCDQKAPTGILAIDNSCPPRSPQPKQISWPKFCLDFSGFQHILHKSYEDVRMFGSCIHQEISFGMWQYYHTMMLWKKILRILGNRGEKYLEHLQIEALIPDMPIHFAIAEYLNGIGSIDKDHQGKFAKFIVQGYPIDHVECGAMGSFGRITAENHWIYETLPAPIVSLLKISADLNYTTASGQQYDWDLPSGLRPEEEAATLPTASLLGWARAVRMTDFQIKLLKEAGFSRTNFGVTNAGTIPVNGDLVRMIGYLLEKSELSVFEKMHPGIAGSMAQIPYWELTEYEQMEEESCKESPLVNIASKRGITELPAFFCDHVQTKAQIFRYRMKRMSQGKSEKQNLDVLCYRFNRAGPPESWLSSANASWEFNEEKLNWNTGTWAMPLTEEPLKFFLSGLCKK